MQVFPDSVSKVWNGWEIRGLVLLSLFLQIILIVFGSTRKYITRRWVHILVWVTYLTADWVATIVLGILANVHGEYCRIQYNVLQAFWAPFLLLHLGGPDTITAYSLEDNELWLRHLLEFIVQTGVALYIVLRAWDNTLLSFITVPIFVSGIIKYGERTWVLWCSSTERFRDSLLLTRDPCPDLIRIFKKDSRRELRDNGGHLIGAYFLFKRFSYLYAGLLLNSFEAMESSITFDYLPAQDVFKMLAIELGFMYDVLYTKVTIVYSRLGIFLRCICFVASVSVLVLFLTMIDIHEYSQMDVYVTYVLLAGATVLEVYALILHLSSDWTRLCFPTKAKNEKTDIDNAVYASSDSRFFNHKSWSESMGQFNLLSYCLKDLPAKCIGVDKLLGINKSFEKYMYTTWEYVSPDLEDMILDEFKQKLHTYGRAAMFNDFELRKKVLAQRGDFVLEERYELGDFRWCTVEAEFDHSVLIWHIATDLCYSVDLDRHGGANNISSQCKVSRRLSNYMMYLLTQCPSMMPKGIGELRFIETCDEATKFLQPKHNVMSNKLSEGCKVLLQTVENTSSDDDLSVLPSACKLAKQLQQLESKSGWNYQKKWKMISKVWVEMLGYAAIHCEWREHGQQLRKGGELLTHVCLLMTHLGFSEQYRIYAKDIC